MKDQKCIEEINTIFQEAPAGRESLLTNYKNLLNVADYCEKNYLQVDDQTKALEETKAFTTQSLASVAYQISGLANSVLKLLDAQTAQLQQTVDMHREKVSRREIGVFTTGKKVNRSQRIIAAPSSQVPKPNYSRTPISYASLDSLGHGIRESGKQLERTGTMNRKQGGREAGGTLGRASRAPEPVQCPVAPSLSRGPSVSSLTDRSSSSFGIAVPPPMAPNSMGADVSSAFPEECPPPPPMLNDSSIPPPPPLTLNGTNIPPPPPLAASSPGLPGSPSHACIPPPPPAPALGIISEESILPPPMTSDVPLPPPVSDGFDLPAPPPPPSDAFNPGLQAQPPPPPLEMSEAYDDILPPLPPPVDYDVSAPPNYLEKVVALYSYDTGNPGDLSFKEGDVMYLMSRNEDGWCEGVLNGQKGFFPGNYVERTS
ncbi:hypothetical protein JZ751_008110 [Albula glossodonta]|uniref:ABI gene family member 3 n=1 Tax=Albula glossodonta TaxID=121402 RepID=A0A8T2P116_9TELE|nr:hypothetical protein JZ751_008110 [Albula glossodonta]